MASLQLISKQDFEVLAEFRYQMRRFERFSELAAQSEGITPQQYLLMLQIQGTPGRDWATVGELAERLQMKHHGAVALVSRCETQDLVVRKVDQTDRRRVRVHLTARGLLLVQRLATLHQAQLESLNGVFEVPRMDPIK